MHTNIKTYVPGKQIIGTRAQRCFLPSCTRKRIHIRRDVIKFYCMCWCVRGCYWSVNRLLVCPALPPTGLICEMTQGVKPILSDVSLIVAGSLKAHPQSSPVKAWRIWGLSDSVAITSRLRLSHCAWQGRQRGFRHRERERKPAWQLSDMWCKWKAGEQTGRQKHRHRDRPIVWLMNSQTGSTDATHAHTGAQVHQL